MSEKKARFGIVGVGNMGSSHAATLQNAKGCELVALYDVNPDAIRRNVSETIRSRTRCHADAESFFSDPEIDVVVVAVPHYFHPELAIQAMRHGKHVLVEKPIAVHKKQAEELLAEGQKHPELVQSLMLNQRTMAAHVKIKQMLDRGDLGAVRRVCWEVTDWFRTQSYYDSGDWRASWRGEGGGVLLNQCPHQIDLFQWFFGMPSKVRATAKIGKYHKIEVEDEVNAYFEFPNGATANFIACTGEAPGTNRLEIVGERGLLILENDKIHFRRNEVEMSEFIRTSASGFAKPPCWECEVPGTNDPFTAHRNILENVAAAVLHGTPLIAPLAEGIRSLELGNAMLYSGLNDCTVTLPLDSGKYAAMLKKLIATSKWKPKKVKKSGAAADFAGSYGA